MNKFNYQLTQWLPQCELDFAIRQIEKYEPNSEGQYYSIKQKNSQVAIFTRGIYIENQAMLTKSTRDLKKKNVKTKRKKHK